MIDLIIIYQTLLNIEAAWKNKLDTFSELFKWDVLKDNIHWLKSYKVGFMHLNQQ